MQAGRQCQYAPLLSWPDICLHPEPGALPGRQKDIRHASAECKQLYRLPDLPPIGTVNGCFQRRQCQDAPQQSWPDACPHLQLTAVQTSFNTAVQTSFNTLKQQGVHASAELA